MHQLILYSHPDCHLCEEAEALIHRCGMADTYQIVDIEDDPELQKRYGIHVPVLKREDNQRELFWPFDRAALVAFVEEEV